MHNAIYGALARALPRHVQAGSGSFWSVRCFAEDADGRATVSHVLPNGGKGAVWGRDGLPTIAFPGNGTITPAEIVENTVPVLVVRRRLRPDSGGAGTHRGGLGQEIALRPHGPNPVRISVRPDKIRFPAPGLAGGRSGAPGALLLDGRPLPAEPRDLGPGSELVLRLPGGGGYGHPRRRARELVTADLAAGYITRRSAVSVYGLRPEKGKRVHRTMRVSLSGGEGS
jgi:N-methylhydantoinase B